MPSPNASTTAPKLILFDAGGVLVVPPLSEHHRLFAPHLTLEQVRGAFYSSYSRTSIPTQGRHDDFWALYAYELGLRHDPFSSLDPMRPGRASPPEGPPHHLVRWNEAVPGALDTVAALKRTGVPIAVVSNAAGDVHELLAEAGVCHLGPEGPGVEIDGIYDSGDRSRYKDETDSRKPSARMIHDACSHFGVDRSETLFVGDALWSDALAAHRAGVKFVHFDPYGGCRDVVLPDAGFELPANAHDHMADIAETLAFVLHGRVGRAVSGHNVSSRGLG